MWEIETSDDFAEWFQSLSTKAAQSITAGIDMLSEKGPALGRPTVDTLEGSRIHNLKELRASSLRVIFAFDPRRTAILLVGGDKAQHGWSRWYPTAIRQAEQLYEAHLQRLRKEQ